MGIADEIEFATKPELAIGLLADLIAEGSTPPWCAGDEVYGRCARLRTFCEDHEIEPTASAEQCDAQ